MPLMKQLTPEPDGAVLPLRLEGVTYYNNYQACGSYRHIYSPEDIFDQVRAFMAAFPDVADRERPRFSILGDSAKPRQGKGQLSNQDLSPPVPASILRAGGPGARPFGRFKGPAAEHRAGAASGQPPGIS